MCDLITTLYKIKYSVSPINTPKQILGCLTKISNVDHLPHPITLSNKSIFCTLYVHNV